jgi:3' exoribonuclease, RNase T-like
MYLFLDTEFTGFATRELISLALVSEDGLHEFYVELSDFDREACDPFVIDTVLPQLGKIEDATCSWSDAALRLRVWLIQLAVDQRFASDSETDYWLLKELLTDKGRYKIPANLDQTWVNVSDTSIHGDCGAIDVTVPDASPELGEHHALADARALRLRWLSLINRTDT